MPARSKKLRLAPPVVALACLGLGLLSTKAVAQKRPLELGDPVDSIVVPFIPPHDCDAVWDVAAGDDVWGRVTINGPDDTVPGLDWPDKFGMSEPMFVTQDANDDHYMTGTLLGLEEERELHVRFKRSWGGIGKPYDYWMLVVACTDSTCHDQYIIAEEPALCSTEGGAASVFVHRDSDQTSAVIRYEEQ